MTSIQEETFNAETGTYRLLSTELDLFNIFYIIYVYIFIYEKAS